VLNPCNSKKKSGKRRLKFYCKTNILRGIYFYGIKAAKKEAASEICLNYPGRPGAVDDEAEKDYRHLYMQVGAV